MAERGALKDTTKKTTRRQIQKDMDTVFCSNKQPADFFSKAVAWSDLYFKETSWTAMSKMDR